MALTEGTLLRIDPLTDELQPELAETWTVDPDRCSITFTLRPGLKFSDGAALTANDVARNLRGGFDPENASPVGDPFRSAQGLPAIEVESPLRITIRYSASKAGLERLFDQLYIASIEQRATAGPFFVTEYRAGESLLLKRNPYYWKRDNAGRRLPVIDKSASTSRAIAISKLRASCVAKRT